jgi:hypothetical protein
MFYFKKIKYDVEMLCDDLCPYKKFKDIDNNITKYPIPKTPGHFICTKFLINKNLDLAITPNPNDTHPIKNCGGLSKLNTNWEQNPKLLTVNAYVDKWINNVKNQLFHVEYDDKDDVYDIPLEVIIFIKALNDDPKILKYRDLYDLIEILNIGLH